MSFVFKLQQEDADEFSFTIEEDTGATWVIPAMATSDAVALYKAVTAGIGEYVREREAARREFEAGMRASGHTVDSFEGVGDFNSDDPMERYRAHQAAKGRAT